MPRGGCREGKVLPSAESALGGDLALGEGRTRDRDV